MTLLDPGQPPHCSGFFYGFFLSMHIQAGRGRWPQFEQNRIDVADYLATFRRVRAANVDGLKLGRALDRVKHQRVG